MKHYTAYFLWDQNVYIQNAKPIPVRSNLRVAQNERFKRNPIYSGRDSMVRQNLGFWAL